MILTRIELNTKKKATMMALANPNKFHGALESAKENHEERILWRIDSLNSKDYLMILSSSSLKTNGLIEQFGYEEKPAQSVLYDKLLNRISPNSRWRFRFVANPTFSEKPAKENGRGKVHSHVSVKYQLEWLEKQGKKHGFIIDHEHTNVIQSRWITFKKHGIGRNVLLKQAAFEGILTVNDPDLFKQALQNGIGRGKAYGMGMLTIVSV